MGQACEGEVDHVVHDSVGEVGADLVLPHVARHQAEDLEGHQLGVGVGLMMHHFAQKTDDVVGSLQVPLNPGRLGWFFYDDVEVNGKGAKAVGNVHGPGLPQDFKGFADSSISDTNAEVN